MSFFGVSGMYYSGESLGEHRIVLAEDSNLFSSMVSKRLKELFDIDVIVCRDYEDLQFAVENASFPPALAISNINLPGAENGEALNYLIDKELLIETLYDGRAVQLGGPLSPFNNFADPQIVHELKGLEFKEEKDRNAVTNLINKHKKMHVEDLVSSIGLVLIPVFFVYVGMQINFGSLLQPHLYVLAAAISIVAIFGKAVAGLGAKGSFQEKMLVGMSMVPRGEVGLIFAATGKGLGVLSDELFSVIVLVVVMTTFVAPPIIKRLAYRIYPDKFEATEKKESAPRRQAKPLPATSSI